MKTLLMVAGVATLFLGVGMDNVWLVIVSLICFMISWTMDSEDYDGGWI